MVDTTNVKTDYLKTEGLLTYGAVNKSDLDPNTVKTLQESDRHAFLDDGTLVFKDKDGSTQIAPQNAFTASVNLDGVDQSIIEKAADIKYLAQTTGVSTNEMNAVYESLGLDPNDSQNYVKLNTILKSAGYNPGSNTDFYGNNSANDVGAQILYERNQQQPTEQDLIDAGLDPNKVTVINSNTANSIYLAEELERRGIDKNSTLGRYATTSNRDTLSKNYSNVEKILRDQGPSGHYYNQLQGQSFDDATLDMLEWDLIKKQAGVGGGGTGGGTGGGSGIVGGVIGGGGGTGGIGGGYTTGDGVGTGAGATDDYSSGTGSIGTQVDMGASGTYTTPAETFNTNITNQVEELKNRETCQAELYKPQTVTEKYEAGEDISGFALSQKMYRNPNTGHQLYIAFRGNTPIQPIPPGYYEINQGTTNVFNPVTAGGNTYTPYTGAANGGYIQGFSGEDGSVVEDGSTATGSANPVDPNQIYGDVSFTDPVTGQVVTQTPDEYYQTLGNRQADATLNPGSYVAMPGVTTMAEVGYVYDENGQLIMDPETGEPMMQELMPGTVLDSDAGQASLTAPVIGGDTLAQVTDTSQAVGLSAEAQYDENGNLISAAIPDTSTADYTAAAGDVKDELDDLTAQTSTGPTQTVVGQTSDTSSVAGLDAATGDSVDVTGAPTRTLDSSELITETGVDQSKVIEAFGEGELQAASVQDELAGLMQQFEGGQTPPWAAGAMRKAMATMAQRGIGASSVAGQAIIQAAMESALPIAQIDAGNKQQMALFKGEQRAKFLQMDFDQAFQAKVINAAKVSEIANMNFTAEQQIALENSKAANTMELANLSNKQALIMAEAAALSQLDLASLNNLQQAQVQNAQNFLQIDMANLSNEQATALFKAQQVTNAMLSDAAQANATSQFNAQSENQANQFFSNLAAQISQFNVAQQNAINQFNAEEANSIAEFNAALQNQREMFNAQNYLVVAQANAQWRQNINTANTEAQNVANLTYAKEVNGLTQKALDDYWQKERDIMSYAFAQSEGAADRALKILLGEQSLQAIREQLEFKENEAKSEFWSDLLFGDASFSDVFKLSGS